MSYQPYEPIETDTPGITAPVTPVYSVKPTLSQYSLMVQYLHAILAGPIVSPIPVSNDTR